MKPRTPFTKFFQNLADGEAEAQATDLLAELGQALIQSALDKNGKSVGSMTLKVKLETDPTGTVDAQFDIDIKKPKAKKPRTILWITDKGFSGQNPKQAALPFADMPSAPRTVIDRDDGQPIVNFEPREYAGRLASDPRLPRERD